MFSVLRQWYSVSCILQWCHIERGGVSNHWRLDYFLLNCLFSRRSKKTSKLRVTGLCKGNSTVTGEFPAQRTIHAEIVSIWWHHHANSTRYDQSSRRCGCGYLVPCRYQSISYHHAVNFVCRCRFNWYQRDSVVGPRFNLYVVPLFLIIRTRIFQYLLMASFNSFPGNSLRPSNAYIRR